MSLFYFALFIGGISTGIRMGLGSSLIEAGSKWYFVAIEFVLMSVLSALVFFLVFNLLKKVFHKPSNSQG